ncbi:hypothetical protein AYI68_g6933, partial [Smittium mucronatum]
MRGGGMWAVEPVLPNNGIQ